MVEVVAQTTDGAGVTFEYDFGDTPAATDELFGSEVVYAFAIRGLTIAAQGHARAMVKAGKSVEEIQVAMSQWKPGMPRATKSPEDRLKELIGKMSPEDRRKFLQEELKASKQAA